MNPISRSIAALALAIAAQAAFAGSAVKQEDVYIRVAPGASAEDAYSEIRQQARRACDSRAIYAHRQLANRNECRQRFVADAVAAFDRPELTALHNERSREQAGLLADAGRE